MMQTESQDQPASAVRLFAISEYTVVHAQEESRRCGYDVECRHSLDTNTAKGRGRSVQKSGNSVGMVPPTAYNLALLLVTLVCAAQTQGQDCPSRESVLQEVCSFSGLSDRARTLREQTRSYHNGTDKSEG